MGIRETVANLLRGTGQTTIQFQGGTLRDLVLGLTPEEMFRSQPHLRTVLSFVARNVAHLGLKAYERTSDADRRRLHDDPLAKLFRQPNPDMTGFELMEGLASDLGLYDIAYWLVTESPNTPSGWEIRPIPPSWVQSRESDSAFSVKSYVVVTPGGAQTRIPASDVLVFHGWNPGKPKDGSSPIDTLKHVLEEQMQAWSYRTQVWKRGGRIGSYITRPAGATWSDTARDRFLAGWKAKFTGDGSDAGGTPILEDGMTLGSQRFNAHEEEWVEASKLALSTVAAAYHVSPVMVGILDNANFSNTKEFRKMLYSETLGPTLARIEDRINTFLVPRISKSENAYVEFNIQEKLQGDFEEQAAVVSASTGGPWMLRSEARAMFNLPEVEGMDEPIVPLNVLVGGLASPRDTAPKDIGELVVVPEQRQLKSAPRSFKSADAATEDHQAAAQQVLEKFFKHQRSVLGGNRLKAKADPAWWDSERWDKELADDLYGLSVTIATEIGRAQAAQFGFAAGDYDQARTERFLRAVAESRAGAVNAATRDQIAKALDEGEPVDAVFDRAESARAESGSRALVAALAGWALLEAARQLIRPDVEVTKTWITGANPRPTHAAMNGESVPRDARFSNGMEWPGDMVGGVDEIAGCNCGIEITF